MRHWFKDQHFRSLLKNTSYLAVSKAVAAIASIATLAFTGRALGLENFGLLVLIASYAQAANGLSKFQSWQLVIRYGAAALAKGDEPIFKRASSYALGLDLTSGLLGMVAALLLLPLIGGWFGIDRALLGYALLYCLLIPTMGASSPSGMLRALDRFDLISWQGVVTPIIRAALAGVGYWQGWELPSFIALWAATDLIGDLFLWFLAWRELKRRKLVAGIRPSLRAHDLPNAWPFAIQVNLTSSLMAAWGPIARLIVGGLLGPASAAIYRVAASLADSAQKPADLLAKAYYPEVVRMDLATRQPWQLMVRGTVLAGAFGLAGVLLLLVGGRPLIGALFGSDFLGVYPVLLIMVGVPLLAILSFPLPPMLYALDRPDAPLKARIVGTALYFAIVAPLCWRFDVQGAAVAIVIGHAAMIMVLLWQLRREHRRVRAK
ncbi:MAG: lipopolysaccharide biosynthesis protein [Sphingomonas bacterium]|nr:lipopolysaccharide biosynthesis protein [Sphingomonas bacterium]